MLYVNICCMLILNATYWIYPNDFHFFIVRTTLTGYLSTILSGWIFSLKQYFVVGYHKQELRYNYFGPLPNQTVYATIPVFFLTAIGRYTDAQYWRWLNQSIILSIKFYGAIIIMPRTSVNGSLNPIRIGPGQTGKVSQSGCTVLTFRPLWQ